MGDRGELTKGRGADVGVEEGLSGVDDKGGVGIGYLVR